MKNLSKRRLYVMDCGDFIKIGVSCNVERRKNQIPYKVKQYYCTEPIKNAFEIEKLVHNALRDKNIKGALGREYFDAKFLETCEYVKTILAIRFGINLEEVFECILSQIGKESRMMGFAYISALHDKEENH